MSRGTVWLVFANGDRTFVPDVTVVVVDGPLLRLEDRQRYNSNLMPRDTYETIDRGTYVLANIRSWKKEDR